MRLGRGLVSIATFLTAFKGMALSSSASTTTRIKGVTYGPNGAVVSCLFCRIMARQEPGTIVYEDADTVAFKTIAPASSNHVLICPRKHVQNYMSLSGPKGAALVRSLVDVGRTVLGADADNAQFSFHVPPFNSIDHLHLHAIGRRETMGFIGGLKYWEGAYWCKSAEAAIPELENTLDRPDPVVPDNGSSSGGSNSSTSGGGSGQKSRL
jgi:diadenosine tetraphosphate (Ap4A) HIT family hydrolase